MLNHKFTAREAAVILILVAVILGYFYYYVVYQYFEDQMARYDIDEVQDEIDLEQMNVAHLQKMKDTLDAEGPSNSELGVYNNQSEELSALASILEGKATDISMNWSDPELNGTIVRRDVTISFSTGSFEDAGEIIKEIADCDYTLLIVDLTMNESSFQQQVEVDVTTTPTPAIVADDENADVNADSEVNSESADVISDSQDAKTTESITVIKSVTSVTLTIRFFETTEGAANLNGLTQAAPEITIDEDDDSLVPSTEELNEQINGD